jgi:hypothetical protein
MLATASRGDLKEIVKRFIFDLDMQRKGFLMKIE